ncbi:MAG: cupin domain-containing protein [Sphingobium sp.]|nr:MAG: cupin domain-containing protein [Sphingobium sp.]
MAPLPAHGSVRLSAGQWQMGERPGERIRALVDDPRGYRSLLMQVAPGPLGALHAHDEIEQIYVIEGDFFDDDASYGPGDFLLRMPGTMHRAGSRNGCTMMIVYTPLIENPK